MKAIYSLLNSSIAYSSPKCCLKYSSVETILFLLLGPLYEKPGENYCMVWEPRKTVGNCTSEKLVYIHIVDTLNHITDHLPLSCDA